MKNFSKVLWGVFFVIIGIIIGVNALGIADINIFFKGWWTLFIIIPCLIGLFDSNMEGKTGNLIRISSRCSIITCNKRNNRLYTNLENDNTTYIRSNWTFYDI